MRRSPRPGGDADWRAVDVELDRERLDVHGGRPGRRPGRGRRPLPGDFNVANALAAIAACAEAGFDAGAGRGRDRRGGGVPGRLERVDEGQDFIVVVDYAHKPDAVEAALRTLRPLTDGRVIVVIGAGGDRDPGKRPIMGEIAARLADVLVVTDDNPRSEDPAAIRARDARRRAADGGRARCSRSATAATAIRRGRRVAPARATRRWSPARATRPARRSPASCTRSTTATSSGAATGAGARR